MEGIDLLMDKHVSEPVNLSTKKEHLSSGRKLNIGNITPLMTQSPCSVAGQTYNVIRKPYIPENASEKELKIHLFLDSLHCYSVNIKGMIEEDFKN